MFHGHAEPVSVPGRNTEQRQRYIPQLVLLTRLPGYPDPLQPARLSRLSQYNTLRVVVLVTVTTAAFGYHQLLWSEDSFFFFFCVEFLKRKTSFDTAKTSKQSHVTAALEREHAGCSVTASLAEAGCCNHPEEQSGADAGGKLY